MFKQLAMTMGMTALAVVLAAPANADDHANVAMEREAIELIEDIEEVGRDVRYHAERLHLFMTSGADVSRWSHYHHLDEIKALVNDRLRPALVRLDEIESALPEWKQDSIDKMVGAAQELAKDASSAIMAKRTGSTIPVINAEYRTLVNDITAHAKALVKTADAAHTYAVAHLKATEAGLVVRK